MSVIAAPALAAQRTTVTGPCGAITTTVDVHLAGAVAHAVDGGYQVLLVVFDSPGGSEAMSRCAESGRDADPPVIVYSVPSGAKAASAGTLSTFPAHAMATAADTTSRDATRWAPHRHPGDRESEHHDA